MRLKSRCWSGRLLPGGSVGRICFHKIQVVDRTIVAVGLNSLFPGWLSGTILFLEASTFLLYAPSMFKPAASMLNPSHTLNLSDFHSATNWGKNCIQRVHTDNLLLINSFKWSVTLVTSAKSTLLHNIIMGIISHHILTFEKLGQEVLGDHFRILLSTFGLY